MTSGSRLEMVSFAGVGWRLPWCSGLFWSLPGSISLFPKPSMAMRWMMPWSVVTPSCYCSSYSTSIVPLQYLYNSYYGTTLIQGRWRFLLMKWITWSPFESLNFQTPVHCGSLSSVYFFSELVGADLDHTSKIETVSHNLFYKCVKFQNSGYREVFG
jgi:hypothetical protein